MSKSDNVDVSYLTAVASLKLVDASSVLDISEDDYAFFTGDKLWISTDRSRARRCIESAVYGALDYLGFPRFPAPVEYISAVIAYYVHPMNIQTACLIMNGAEFSENIVNGVERPCTHSELFAHVLRLRAGCADFIESREEKIKQLLKLQ